MKRFILCLLALTILFSLSACGAKEEPVRFYYQRTELQYADSSSVIVSEPRDSLSRSDSLDYLLAFYMEGPLDDSLSLPLPPGTRIKRILFEDSTITLVMSREFARLKGMDLTLAAGCIASTCFDLTDARQVTLTTDAGKPVSITLFRNSLTLEDTVIQETDSTEATQ